MTDHDRRDKPALNDPAPTMWQRLWQRIQGSTRRLWDQGTTATTPALPGPSQASAEPTWHAVDQPIALLPSLLDAAKLTQLAKRREILAWRDDFHVRMTRTAQDVHDRFIDAINHELEQVGLFGKIFSQHSSDALKVAYQREVHAALFSWLGQEERQLQNQLASWGLPAPTAPFFNKSQFDEAYSRLAYISFKPSNRELILQEVQSMFFGDAGITPSHCQQAQNLTMTWLEDSHTC